MRSDKDTDSRRSLSVKGRLFLLLTVMIVPFIAFSIFKAYEIHNHLEEEASINSLSLAKNIAQDIDDYIQSTSELLILLANNTDVRAQNYPAVDAWLKKIKPKYPFYSNIIFVDTDGYIQATARPTDGGPEKVNVRDTTYFKRAMRSSSIAVGDFMHGKISGAPVVHVTYPVFDYSGKKIGFVAAAFDLTKIQNKLMRSSVHQHTLIAVLDSKGVMIARSGDPEKWIGKNYAKRISFKKMLEKSTGTGKVKSPDGSTRVFGFAPVSKAPWYVRVGVDENYIHDQVNGELKKHFAVFVPLLLIAIIGWLRIGRDVGRLHKRTEHLSLVDPLTELWNYRKLDQDLDREISRAERYGEQVSLAMIDVDHFKHYNDRNGHQMGNELLCFIAGVISDTVRDVDSVYRYGGEEMCVLLPATGSSGAKAVAERIRTAIENTHFVGEENQPLGKVTISAGVAMYPHDSLSKEGLVKNADIALYRAKREGRNKVEAYSEGDSRRGCKGSYYAGTGM